MMNPSQQRVRGNALIITLITIVILTAMLGVAQFFTVHIARSAQRSRAWLDSTAIGVGSLDLAFSSWRQICRASYTQALPTSSFTTIPTPTAANFPGVPTFTLSNYSIQAVDPQLNPVGGAPPSSTGQYPSFGSVFYLASADVSIPVIPGSVTAKVRRIFEKQTLSPWEWAIFFNDPLEIQPGPPFTVTGWVHTNSMLYTGHSSLTFASKVTYTGGWKIGFMPGDGTHPETPTSPYWPQDLPPAKDQAHEPNGLDPTQVFDASSSNPNINSGWRELIQIPKLPLSTYPDPISTSRYYNQAGIKVLVDNSKSGNGNSNNSLVIMNAAGTVVDDNSSGNNLAIYNLIQNAITTQGGTIQDNREGAQVRLTTLDVSQIKTAVNNNTITGFNGIIYITDVGVGGGAIAKRGIRLSNGSILPNGGLTVVSQNPIYIQGNYNTGGSSPPSNSGDPTNPTVAGYTRQPAAVIGDAVNILSSSWNDGSSGSSLSSRVATNTTVNAAILGGIVPTGTVGSNYSGGVENFPRFLEDWTGKSLTVYGSMVELYSSAQSTGIWGSANVYNPPTRNWYFDNNFQSKPPPGSLVVTNYIKQRWFLN